MNETAHHILVVESDLEQVHLLEEAFTERAELRSSGVFAPLFVRDYALDLPDATAALQAGRFDAVLLDMLTVDGAESFSRLQTLSPDSPFVALVPMAEEALGVRLVRMGAQDYLIREEIDCMPLARALRAAIERHGLWRAVQATALTDSLTGLYNRRGFLGALRRDGMLAARLGLPFTLTFYDGRGVDGRSSEPQSRDLRLLQAADLLRRGLPEDSLAGRWDEDRLAVACFGEGHGRPFPLASLGFNATTVDTPSGASSIDQLVEAAEQLLCHNGQFESCAGRHP
ncbi:MAG: hypothetical protein R2762_23325 [Bryobacteraceae bacterium]